MKSEVIEIGGITVRFTRKKIKNMHIRISVNDGSVSVSVPTFVNMKTVEKFVLSRADWIKENLKRIENKSDYNKKFVSGETVEFCGIKYTLFVESSDKNNVLLTDNSLTVFTRKTDSESVKKLLDAFYKKSLTERSEPLIKTVENLTGLYSSSLVIRDMKTRWGSCNTRTKRICLNLQLAKFDDETLKYVITHEILHIRHPNHGKEFKADLQKYCENWKQIRKKLNGN